MSEQPEALRLADALESDPDSDWLYEIGIDKAAAELRRLHALNAELVEALRLALDSHGLMLLSDPPQEAWKVWDVEAKGRAALAKAEGV